MPVILSLSNEDARALRTLLHMFRRQSRDISGLLNDLGAGGESTADHYIALVPSGGIPAATPAAGTGDLLFAAGDVPGSADCEIFKIVSGSLVSIGQTKKVYNLTSSAVSQSWVTVTRTKFGAWTVGTGGGGGTPTCNDRNEQWQIWVIGAPGGGTFDITFTAGGFEDTITVYSDSTALEAVTAFETHTGVGSGDVAITGGDLPYINLNVTFQGNLAGTLLSLTKVDYSGLSGTPGTATVGDELAGLGVIITRPTLGYPN